MKGLSVVPCKGKKCLAICHVWLDALLARIAPYKQPATKNRQTVFPAHQRNEQAQVFIFQLFFKFPGKPLRDFYAEYSPHTNTATLNFFVCLPEFLKFLKFRVETGLSSCPPHRPVRADFPHTVLQLGVLLKHRQS